MAVSLSRNIQIRVRVCRRDDKYKRIDVGDRRADKRIFTRKYLCNKALARACDAKAHLISSERYELIAAERAFGTAINRFAGFIRSFAAYFHTVQTAGAFDDTAV